MASANTLCKKLLNVKKAVVTGHDFYMDADGVNHIRIHAAPISGTKMTVPSAINAADHTTGTEGYRVSGGDRTGAVRLSKWNIISTVLSVPSTASWLRMSPGHTQTAGLRRTSTLLPHGLQLISHAAPYPNICASTGRLSADVSTAP